MGYGDEILIVPRPVLSISPPDLSIARRGRREGVIAVPFGGGPSWLKSITGSSGAHGLSL